MRYKCFEKMGICNFLAKIERKFAEPHANTLKETVSLMIKEKKRKKAQRPSLTAYKIVHVTFDYLCSYFWSLYRFVI